MPKGWCWVKLSELIETLQGFADELGGEDGGVDPEVMMAHQPSWPLEMPVGSVVMVDLEAPDEEDEAEFDAGLEAMTLEEREAAWAEKEDSRGEPKWVVYVAEGSWGGNGYLAGVASRELGYR